MFLKLLSEIYGIPYYVGIPLVFLLSHVHFIVIELFSAQTSRADPLVYFVFAVWLSLITRIMPFLGCRVLAPADLGGSITDDTEQPLGIMPHQVRGFVAHFAQLVVMGHAFDKCTACSATVSSSSLHYFFYLEHVIWKDIKPEGILSLSNKTGSECLKWEHLSIPFTVGLRGIYIWKCIALKGRVLPPQGEWEIVEIIAHIPGCQSWAGCNSTVYSPGMWFDQVVNKYREGGMEFVLEVLNRPNYLEDLTGLTELLSATQSMSLDWDDDNEAGEDADF